MKKSHEIAEEDYKLKLSLKKKEEDYYPSKMQETGLKDLSRFVRYHPCPSRLMKREITYAHLDLESVVEAMGEEKPWCVVSGTNPSGPLHLGHKTIFDGLLWLQEQGAEIYIPITNDETYVVDKSNSLSESRKNALELVIPSIIAMGFNPDKTHIFVDTDYKDLYLAAIDLSKRLTLSKAQGIFGIKKEDNPGILFYRSCVQTAQILLPQYEEFGGPKPTLIPVGIDQHPYILLSRYLADKKGFVPPAELCSKFLWGLDGKGKMASSRSESAIFLNDSIEDASKKIRASYTGGSPLASIQKERGGIPEICPIYSIQHFHFDNSEEIYQKCTAGELMCRPCKENAIENVAKYLKEHQSKIPYAKEQIPKFTLNKELRSLS